MKQNWVVTRQSKSLDVRHRSPVSATSLQVLLTSLHYMCDCRPFKWKIIFGSKVPSCSLHHRQFNFYVLRRTFSFSAGVTNGIQKAFNGLPPALKAAPTKYRTVFNLIRIPTEVEASSGTGFHFCVAPSHPRPQV